MQPIIIVVTPGAIVALAILLAAVVALRACFRRRPALPREHGLRKF